MASANEMDIVEVDKKLLEQLQDMGFPLAPAARALHHSGNSGLEAAVNWIVDHENDPDIDQMPLIAVNIDIECPPEQQSDSMEEMEAKVQELRDRTRKRREEEEKKLEREREKERIKAGKQILEAKRIGEDSERRRYLAEKKAEKEEEKRARERIRLKLEEDKAERRRMLGLPPVSGTAIQNARPAIQENKQSYVPVKSVEKAEQLRECLRSLKHNHKDDESKVKRAFQTLLIYVGNVARNPDEEKFRKIRIANPAFQTRVGRLRGGIQFLQLCGFEITEEGKFLHLPRDKVDMAVLNLAGSVLQSAVTNPFFGLLSWA